MRGTRGHGVTGFPPGLTPCAPSCSVGTSDEEIRACGRVEGLRRSEDCTFDHANSLPASARLTAHRRSVRHPGDPPLTTIIQRTVLEPGRYTFPPPSGTLLLRPLHFFVDPTRGTTYEARS